MWDRAGVKQRRQGKGSQSVFGSESEWKGHVLAAYFLLAPSLSFTYPRSEWEKCGHPPVSRESYPHPAYLLNGK